MAHTRCLFLAWDLLGIVKYALIYAWVPTGMLNKGVLALNVPVVGLRGRLMLTKTLEWNLRWCVLDSMFDEKHFRVRREFVDDPGALQLRFKCAPALKFHPL